MEGLVHVNSLRRDYFVYDSQKQELVGELTKKTYALGDRVTVRVADADCVMKTVDLWCSQTEMTRTKYERARQDIEEDRYGKKRKCKADCQQ